MIQSLLIVVPTLNSYQQLPVLVSSLQSQTLSNWRILFVDGQSLPEHRQWLRQCCEIESRCSWIHQLSAESGIFGAMNQGFAAAKINEWLLFWGSDDWAPASTVFADALMALNSTPAFVGSADLLVCRGRYVHTSTGALGRVSKFELVSSYRRSLLLGFTPPHQASLIGPSARARLAHFTEGFYLSADLDYFLQLSHFADLRVQVLNLELVHMSSGGISGQQTRRRLQEVFSAYQRAFGWLWWFPFLARYMHRLFSLLEIRH